MNLSPLRFKSFALFSVQFMLAAALITLTACAGSRKTAAGDGPSLGSDSSPESAAPVNTQVDDAKRSAEEAEQRAHELRMEKAKSQSKSSAN